MRPGAGQGKAAGCKYPDPCTCVKRKERRAPSGRSCAKALLNRVEPRINSSLVQQRIGRELSAVCSYVEAFCLSVRRIARIGADMGIISNVKEEIRIIRERDPAIHSSLEVFLYPSFKAMLHYRLAHKLYLKKHFFLARYISQRGARKTGIEIHPGARIGKGFFIDHGNGVIIGETSVIGDNVTLYQGVTLGGTGKEHGKRHPTVGNNVMISAGAKVLGSFTIGDNSKIGAGSVVLSEVPPNSTVVGVPGRVVKRNHVALPQDTMNQTDLPDPVREDIACLQKANTELTNRLLDLEAEVRRLIRELKKKEENSKRVNSQEENRAADRQEKLKEKTYEHESL